MRHILLINFEIENEIIENNNTNGRIGIESFPQTQMFLSLYLCNLEV